LVLFGVILGADPEESPIEQACGARKDPLVREIGPLEVFVPHRAHRR
jgi:hypothetical protein